MTDWTAERLDALPEGAVIAWTRSWSPTIDMEPVG